MKRSAQLTPVFLAGFFALAALICAVAGASLLDPEGPLSPMWRIKPDEYRQMLALGPFAGIGFLTLSTVMAAASVGTARRQRWGWRLGCAIFAVNGLADAARIPFGAVTEGMIGLVAASAILWWLARPAVRAEFAR